MEMIEMFFEMQLKDRITSSKETILNQINTMTCLLDNILFLDESKDDVHNATFNQLDIIHTIRYLVDDVIDLHKAKQKIFIKTDDESVIAYSDASLLKQIINNLLSNAIKYSPVQSDIIITLINTDKHFSIIVQDFGPGISDDVIDKIFESFVRSQDFTNISGSGLGLSITKKCVESLGGEISFDTQKGEGTIFYVKLPKFSTDEINQMNIINNLSSDQLEEQFIDDNFSLN